MVSLLYLRIVVGVLGLVETAPPHMALEAEEEEEDQRHPATAVPEAKEEQNHAQEVSSA